MKGIQFIVDENGEKTAVVIDLKEWGNLWQQFSQILLRNLSSKEDWLHQPQMEEKLDQALEWNCNHQPKISDLEALETKLNDYE